MPIEFRILGPLEVSADGCVLPLGSPKQRALLGLLLVHANETVSRDRLIEELWGEAAPATVESALHVYLSRLRRLLESAGAGDRLVHEAWGYRLRVEPEELDINLFERLVGEGGEALAAGNPPVAAGCLREALALWRGPALADLQSERFAIDAGARLEEQRISALEQRLEADLTLGRDHELVPELETLLAQHPYREGLRAQLMLALHRSGRQVEALRVYQQARRKLAEELGLEPGQELKELERAILRNDPELIVQPSSEPGGEGAPASRATLPVPAEERKVVTVMVAEMVVGEDRDEPDPEDLRALQRRYLALVRAAVEQYGGTVQTFVGNVVTAVFGAPRVHEDDPERAVRAALAISDWAHGEKHVEVGIVAATGEVLVRLLAGSTVGESVLAGEIVVTAAHVQAAAPTGAVLVGERTYRATRRFIDYREAESVQVRGKTEPIRVWEALAVRSGVGAEAAQRERSPFVGRERELRLLQATLTRVRGERAPELVTLVGVPGIGKSRLVEELRRAAAAERGTTVTWCQGRSLPYGDGVSLWALSEIVKALLGALESDTDEQVEQKLGRAVESLLGVGREAEWVARELRPLLGITGGGGVADGDRDETFAAWRRFFEALAERRQLVLVFEDLHWADEALLDFVEGLAEWVRGVPFLILAVARPELLERRPHWAGGKPNAVTLSLATLSEEESGRLLAALSQHLPSTPEAQSLLLAKVGGNPFYAEQYARALDEGAETSELPLPESVQGMIAARLDLLPPAEKSLLQDAAVLGEVFWAGAAAALQAVDPSAAEAHLRALERKQFLHHVAHSVVADETEYAFRHLLLRDVAYAQIPRAERATKHQRAAAWIESLGRPRDHAEALAHHYTSALELTSAAGGDTVEIAARARVALRDAGDRALSLNSAAAAASYYERALELWPEHDQERPQLLFHFASALHTTGDPRQEQTLAHARELLLAAGDIDTAAQADALLAYMWWLAGADEGIERHLLRAAALVRGRAPSAAKARVLALISRLSMLTSKNGEAIRSGREALTIADRLHLPELRADALISVGMGRLATTWDAAGVDDIERGLELALAHNALSTAQGGYTNLAAVMLARGDLARQEQLLAQAELLAQRLGDQQRLRLLRAYRLTSTPFWRGEWDEVLRLADEFIAECEAGAPHSMESSVRVVRATIRLARDDIDGALADCEKAMAHARHVGQPDTAARVLGLSAAIYLELGRVGQAQTLADEALSCHPDLSLVSLALAWDTDALGRRPEVEAALALLPSDNPWRRGAELIREGRFDRAADTFAEIGASMQEARARMRAGQALAKQNRNSEAEKQLEKALAFYRCVQATRYIRQAEALLAGTGTGLKRDRRVALPTADN